jgi:hydroxypyruvate reductase
LSQYARVLVVGAGKAGAPMAQAIEHLVGDRIDAGIVVVKQGHAGHTDTIEIVEAGHPVPNAAGLEAGQRVLALANSAGANDLVLVLLSGGGSALLEATDGISLDDLQVLTSSLLASGATIGEINCLRKHISLIKGGQLARAAYPATLVTLVLSDVVGSPLDVIASGPTVPDPTTWADAWALVQKFRLEARLPVSVRARLVEGGAGHIADTPKPGDDIFERTQTVVIGDNRVAALAACAQARALGYHTWLLSTFVEGEAREVAKVIAALGKEIVASGMPALPPACLVLGGETTVTLTPGHGVGGRNQELALAAALALDGLNHITVASLATDGSDGPTDSAGGLVDGETVARGRLLGIDAAATLARHDAHPFLQATGDLLVSGPTQPNVNDLIFVLVDE